LYDTITRAAAEGRGVRLSIAETQLLAAQPFMQFDPRLLKLEWRSIEGFERYEVSEEGHVRRGLRLLKLTEAKSKHLNVTLYSNYGRPWRIGVHHLVARAFLGMSPEGKPFACHINGRAWDNRPTNLYWGSRVEITADMVRHASLDRGGLMVDSAHSKNKNDGVSTC
jgi:hypothetical protein